MQTLVTKIQSVLTPDLRNREWQRRVLPDAHPTTGHCYIAAEAAYHIYGKRRGFQPHVLRVGLEHDLEVVTHWYLENKLTGERIDPTAEQFSQPLDYTRGRRCPFLTKEPSKRTRVLLTRMRYDHQA
jgi:hypothetical protein